MDNNLNDELSDIELLIEKTLKADRITCSDVEKTALNLQPEDRVQYLNALLTIDGMALKYVDKFEKNVPKLANTLMNLTVGDLRILREETYIDKLTQLKNRSYIEKADRNPKEQYSVLMMDIDKFKEWNDRYGHHVGDITLKVLGSIIRDSIRKTEGYIKNYAARYGGEEFYVELNQTNALDAVKVAERIRSNIEKKGIMLLKRELEEEGLIDVYDKIVSNRQSMTISIGVAEESQGNKTPVEARDRADIALYNAKSNGRNKVIMYENSISIAERV